MVYEFEDCGARQDDARTMQNDGGMGMDGDDLIETLMNDVDLRRRN